MTDLSAILATVPVGIEHVSVDGTILFANAAHCEMHGYAAGELSGRNLSELQIDQEAAETLLQMLARLASDRPEPKPFRQVNKTRNGGRVLVEVHWNYLVDEEGVVTGFASAVLNRGEVGEDFSSEFG